MKLKVSDQFISLEQIKNADEIELSNEKEFIDKIEASHKFLMEQIQAGKPVYGVTTGYGASGKNYLSYEESSKLQEYLYRFHGCGVGEYLSPKESFYTVLIRLISLCKGKSAVSMELIYRLSLLLNRNILPVIPSQGSVGASGDLTPLSYIAAVIAGEGEAYYNDKILSAEEIYRELNIVPYVFKPKEALAVMNGTAAMSAIGLKAVLDFEIILNSMESFAAGMFEVLLSDVTPLAEFVHEAKPFPGQIQCAANLRRKTAGSKLTHGNEDRYDRFFQDADLNIQDPYSIRCVPQILGVVRDSLEISRKWLEMEINSTNDNPLIDGQNRKIYTSGNFYGGYAAHAMDTLKISAANLADLLDKEFALLIDYKFNRGLGENLKLKKDFFFHGFKAVQITLSSLSADVIKNTAAASVYSRPTESLNQDKVSMGTTAALDMKKMIPDLMNMLSIGFIGLAQAVDIRGKENVSPFLMQVYESVRSCSAALLEDRRLDRDIRAVRTMVEEGRFI